MQATQAMQLLPVLQKTHKRIEIAPTKPEVHSQLITRNHVIRKEGTYLEGKREKANSTAICKANSKPISSLWSLYMGEATVGHKTLM